MKYWVYLFGSYARNDYDSSSDLDILIIKNSDNFDLAEIDTKITQIFDKKANYSIYSINGIKNYYKKGHLFSWHLFLESKYLFSNINTNILEKFGKPTPYVNMNNDISDFYYLFIDVETELLKDKYNKLFEIGNFYSVIRNMYFYYVFLNTKKFNFSPYAYYNNKYKAPISYENYRKYKKAKQLRSIGNEIDITLSKNEIYNDILKFKDWIKENFNGKILPKNKL